ncbi:ABC transporter permease [Ruminococcus albus]|uniref:Putative ABC transport system permease protein n=1 Tax=Ruminococcus albus TaxID=1264 RepID=A0A1H7N5X4_RUMAL|nr:FtsX-like permease family protein [Ruminococcus albus]SEL18900.1 putative ABC transport system permease protein [Ruminococcus albus]
MMTALFKDTIREILRSKGRFLSVLLIAALGCGFFSGVKATMPDMVDSASAYFDEYRLMDMKFVSTIGVRSSDVEAVKMADNVRGAHAAYSKDVFYLHDNKNIVLKCISFNSSLDDSSPNLMNKLHVLEGRLPDKDGECAVEVKISSPDTFKIGEKLTFTDPDDTKKLTDTLQSDTFEIVGIVTSPSYIGYERDRTTEGDGTIVSNVFLREEEFYTNYYTEMFVDLEGLDETDPFSEEYRESVKEKGAAARAAFEKSVNERFNDLYTQAQDRIASATNTADTLNGVLDMDIDELQVHMPEWEEKAKEARYIYEREVENGKRAYLEKSAMLQAEKALGIAKELAYDEDGSAHAKYQAQLDDARSEIEAAQKELDDTPEPTVYSYDRFEASTDYSSFEGDSKKVDSIAKVFPVFFMLVAGLVCLATMSRLTEEQRGLIGVYKALGYSRWRILSKYLIYSGAAAILGGTLGSAVGLKIFPRMIYHGYKLLYNIPDISTPLRWGYLVGCTVVSVICICGVTVYTCMRDLKDVPGSLMRPKPPKAGKRVLLENCPALWDKLSFMGKVTTRNMLRSKRRFFMTLAGVTGCTALIITGFGLKNSISSVVDRQFGEVFVYDGIAVLNNRFSYDELEQEINSAEGLADHMQALINEVDLSVDGQKCMVNICVPSETDRLEEFVLLRNTDSGEKLVPQDGSVIITQKLADNLHLRKGSVLTITETDGQKAEFTVADICKNYAFHYVFVTPHDYEKSFGRAPVYNISFIELAKGADTDAFRDQFLKSSSFYGLTYKDDQSRGFLNSMDSLNTVVAVLIFSAGLLAAVVLYDLASINITERNREIATVKVLGFFDRETDDYILRENLISSAVGILAGLPVGRILHYFVTVTAEVDILMFDHRLSVSAMLYGALITAGFTLAVNAVLHFTLLKVDMIGSLKSVE